jgi:hypothetical protein
VWRRRVARFAGCTWTHAQRPRQKQVHDAFRKGFMVSRGVMRLEGWLLCYDHAQRCEQGVGECEARRHVCEGR